MSTKDRVVNLCIRPLKEWSIIAGEQNAPVQVLLRYYLPLLLIPSLALVLGYGLFGKTTSDGFISFVIKGWNIGIQKALTYLFTTPIVLIISSLAIDNLAPVFRSTRNFERTLVFLGYASTPVLLSGVFYLVPVLDFMFLPGIIVSYVLLWFGIPLMKDTPKASISAYFFAMVIITLSALALVHMIIKSMLGAIWVNETPIVLGSILM
jgi:hypothetical protein